MLKRTLVVAGSVSVAALALGVSGPAQAAPNHSRTVRPATYVEESWISSNSGGANLRQQATTTSTSLGYMTNGTSLHMMCWLDSQTVSPPNSNYTSARWFKISTLSLGGSIGYVHSSLVAGQITVGHC